MKKEELNNTHLFQIYLSICVMALIILGSFSFINMYGKNRIAYIDMSVLKENYKGISKAKKELNNKKLTWQKSMDSLSWALNIKELEEEKKVISNKKDVKMLVTHIVNDYKYEKKYFNVLIQNRIEKEEEKIMRVLHSKLHDFLYDNRLNHDYELILTLDKLNNAVYSKKPKNITLDVLKMMNLEYERKNIN